MRTSSQGSGIEWHMVPTVRRLGGGTHSQDDLRHGHKDNIVRPGLSNAPFWLSHCTAVPLAVALSALLGRDLGGGADYAVHDACAPAK